MDYSAYIVVTAMEAELIRFLENVTGGTRVAFLPLGVPVPETLAVFVVFYERQDAALDVIGPMPLMTGSPKPLTIRLMPRY